MPFSFWDLSPVSGSFTALSRGMAMESNFIRGWIIKTLLLGVGGLLVSFSFSDGFFGLGILVGTLAHSVPTKIPSPKNPSLKENETKRPPTPRSRVLMIHPRMKLDSIAIPLDNAVKLPETGDKSQNEKGIHQIGGSAEK